MVNYLGRLLAIIAAAGLALSGCSERKPAGPPPRANDAIEVAPQSSVIAVPVTADISRVKAKLEREIPRKLWSINRKGMTCLASEKVKVAFVKLKTPKVKCDIVGSVTRGKLTFTGRGQEVVITMPIHADVRAKDIAGIFKQETATGDARVRAVVRLSIAEDWNPRGKVDIKYDWTREPGIDFLGQRVEFTSTADSKLKGVVHQLERGLEKEIARVNLRSQIEKLWGKAFTSVELNRANPPVWMRITPLQLQFGGYSLDGARLSLRLGMKATTETFVGDRPPDPPRIPLPPRAALDEKPGRLTLHVPVIADYAQLEPVILKALVKRAQRPFSVPKVGDLNARFDKVQAYGTTGGRIAVGVTFALSHATHKLGKTKGTVWMTALPANQENSRKVSFKELTISGDTDSIGTDLLLQFANSPNFTGTISQALEQNFERDYGELMAKVERAISERREGELLIRSHLDDVQTGKLIAAGQGVYMPVRGIGTASITLGGR